MPHVIVVQQTNTAQYAGALAGMFRQRARIFKDKLGWDVEVDDDGQERDKYDYLEPVYLICTDRENGDVLIDADGYRYITPGPRYVTGSLRLLPTTGPTLLADAFADTIPDAMFCAPSIWECTRFVAEDPAVASALIAALGELCLNYGIEGIVGNFDIAMLKVYRRIGIEVEVLGKAQRDGRTVYLGIFPVTAEILDRVKSRIADMGRVAA